MSRRRKSPKRIVAKSNPKPAYTISRKEFETVRSVSLETSGIEFLLMAKNVLTSQLNLVNYFKTSGVNYELADAVANDLLEITDEMFSLPEMAIDYFRIFVSDGMPVREAILAAQNMVELDATEDASHQSPSLMAI
jgi:hypothetical protein